MPPFHCSLIVAQRLQKMKAPDRSPYRRPSKDDRVPWTIAAKLLLKESVTEASTMLTPGEPKTPQDCRPVFGQGISPNPTPDRKGKGIAIDSSPQKDTRRKAKEQEKDSATDGPTMANLKAMVQQLRLENRRLEYQLIERKVQIGDLQYDLRTLRRGLSAKIKRLYKDTGQEELYFA